MRRDAALGGADAALNRADDGAIVVPSEYLEVVVVKKSEFRRDQS